MQDSQSETRVLLSAQTLVSGNGGICAVARMTASALASRCGIEALACQDAADHRIGAIPVRAFRNRRVQFLLANLAASQRATRVIYDFAGTARAHVELPFRPRPYAVWVHGLEIWRGSPPKYLRAVSGAGLVLANSAYTLSRADGSLPNDVEVVICPLATPQDDPPVMLGPSDGPPTVMLLGRADELFAKGHDVLIEIWPHVVSAVPEARLLLVGGGTMLHKVRELAAASPARHAIEIAGFVSDEELDAYWRRASVFAMPGFTEGFGLVYIEAMRRGLPVIASTEDAGQEVNVDGATGYNVSCKDKARLTDAVVSLLRDRNLARDLGAAGHQRWRTHYTFSAFSARFAAATRRFLQA
jgi:phosphatidylinositol alpha-1,6-mannosyltransferase